jgi:eukaryotic-like serine/threonine-protein kinase
VVPVHDVGVIDGQVFLVMEFVAGQTLRAWLAETPRSWRDVLAVYIQAGRGLAAAHAVGIVHQDFKPDNALIGDDGRGCGLSRCRARSRCSAE